MRMIKLLFGYIGALIKWFCIAMLILFIFLWYQKEHPTHEHDWYKKTETKIGCLEAEVLYKCFGCDETKTEIISTNNHKLVSKALVAATCTEFGQHRVECTECDYAYETITAPACQPGEFTVTKKPDIFNDGEERATCTVCGKKVTRNIRAIGTDKDSPLVMKPEEFYRAAVGKDGQKYLRQWIQLSGTLQARYDGKCYFIKESDRKLICEIPHWANSNDTITAGKYATIVGYVSSIKETQIELILCEFVETP